MQRRALPEKTPEGSVLERDAGARRLVVIVHIDVVGYSRLVSRDALIAARSINALRSEVIEQGSARESGVLVNTAGDAFLLSFASVRGATRFAMTAQRTIAAGRPDGLAPFPPIRIGIGLSDVLEGEDNLHGDGVNIAARLQQVCPSGGVCITREIHDNLGPEIREGFEPLGGLQLKNIDRVVEAFVHRPGTDKSDPPHSRLALAAADQREQRCTVLLTRLQPGARSPGERQAANALTDQLTTLLARSTELLLLAPRAADLRLASPTSGYILGGQVRQTHDEIRVMATLVHGPTLRTLWAKSFSAHGALTDTRAGRLAAAILAEVEAQIRASEFAKSLTKPAGGLTAYDLYIRGQHQLDRFGRETNERALQFFRAAIRLDPGFARARAAAAACISTRHDQGWSRDVRRDRKLGCDLAGTALRLGGDDPAVLALSGHVYAILGGDNATASTLLGRAIEASPDWAQPWMRSAMVHVYRGEPERAIANARRAIRLAPADPRLFMPLSALGYAHLQLEDFDAARAVAERTFEGSARPEQAYRIMITALSGLGRAQEAKHYAAEMLEAYPGFSIAACRGRLVFARARWFDTIASALTKVGLPD